MMNKEQNAIESCVRKAMKQFGKWFMEIDYESRLNSHYLCYYLPNYFDIESPLSNVDTCAALRIMIDKVENSGVYRDEQLLDELKEANRMLRDYLYNIIALHV